MIPESVLWVFFGLWVFFFGPAILRLIWLTLKAWMSVLGTIIGFIWSVAANPNRACAMWQLLLPPVIAVIVCYLIVRYVLDWK